MVFDRPSPRGFAFRYVFAPPPFSSAQPPENLPPCVLYPFTGHARVWHGQRPRVVLEEVYDGVAQHGPSAVPHRPSAPRSHQRRVSTRRVRCRAAGALVGEGFQEAPSTPELKNVGNISPQRKRDDNKNKICTFQGGGGRGREENCPKRYFSWETS